MGQHALPRRFPRMCFHGEGYAEIHKDIRYLRFSRQNHVAADRLLNPMLQVRRLHRLKPGLFHEPDQRVALGDMRVEADGQHAAGRPLPSDERCSA